MKLFMITPPKGWGAYNEFRGAIVAANTPEEACTIHPGEGFIPQEKNYNWPNDPREISVTYIGTAKPGTKVGVILADFHDA